MYSMLLCSKFSQFVFMPYRKCAYKRKIPSSSPISSSRASRDKVCDVIDPPKTVYQDSWFEVTAINHVSHNLQAVAGIKVEKDGYEGFLETCKAVKTKCNPVQQRQLALESLQRAIPIMQMLPLFKTMLPQTTYVREFFAIFATLFFVWLVGPAEVRESDFKEKSEKNVAHIRKCRFLESSNCVGMCTNLCKLPTQTFLKDSFGMPVTMVPNFEDMSCDILFGVEPPEPDEDPATRQPCYKLCKIGMQHT